VNKENNRNDKNSGRRPNSRGDNFQSAEFEQALIDIARVTRVMAGGKRMRFRACIVLGDKKGKVGSAVAKGADVTIAINKAVAQAKKHMVSVTIVKGTIPHRVDYKFGAAKIMIKPAPRGSGIIAGGAVRQVLEFAGISDVVAKILGTKNKINNVKATIKALQQLKKVEVKKSSTNKQNVSKADKPAELLKS